MIPFEPTAVFDPSDGTMQIETYPLELIISPPNHATLHLHTRKGRTQLDGVVLEKGGWYRWTRYNRRSRLTADENNKLLELLGFDLGEIDAASQAALMAGGTERSGQPCVSDCG
jgi:hypothetical protein